MEIRQLKTLIAIVNAGGFAAAANAVGLTQSAVSQQVKALEDELGATLFDRTARPPALTVEGRTFLDQARRIVGLCDEAAGGIRRRHPSTSLHVGVVRGSLMGHLPVALAVLRSRHPGLKLRVTTGDLSELLAHVQHGRIDAALVPDAPALDPQLHWLPFLVEPFVVVAPARIGGATDQDLLEACPFIQFSRNVRTGRLIDAELRRRAIRVETAMEIDSFPAIVQMVQQGLGAAVVPAQAIGIAPPESIRAVAFGKPPMTRTVGLAERAANPKAALTAELHDELRRLSGESDDLAVPRDARRGRAL